MMLRTLTAAGLAGVLLHTSTLHGQYEDHQPAFTLAHLELSLRVNYDSRTIGGMASLMVRNHSPHPSATISLLLGRLMRVWSVTSAGNLPLSFTQDVVVFADDSVRQVNAIEVRLPRPVPSGDSLTIQVHYDGYLVGYTETGSLYIKDHVSPEFTILREDAYAWPVLGVPSWAANRGAVPSLFTFAARIMVPDTFVVAMGGEQEGRVEQDGLVTWSYRGAAPVPFLNIAIAPYRVLERGNARIFYFPPDSSGARQVEQAIAGAMDRYTRWFGPLHRAARLTVMEIPEGWGSQASLTAGIILTRDAFIHRAELRQLYHELSHLWNVDDLERPSPRWNEGLATFLQWRMAAELDGWNDWAGRIERTVQVLRRDCSAAGCDSLPLADYGRAGITDRSYPVGMLLFHILSQVLGAERFDRIYGSFFQSHREAGATSTELVAAFIAADPRARRIFEDWFTTSRWYGALTGKTVGELIEEYR